MGQEPSAPRGYRFGIFEVELAAAELRRGGTAVRLRGKPFDILTYLLARPGDLVSRDDLRRHLWAADTFVDFDHGLNAAMNRLRDALGDSAENPRFIQTLPRRGYRFIAPVEVVCAPAPAIPERPVEVTAPPTVASAEPGRRAGVSRRMLVVAAVAVMVAAAAVAVRMWWPAGPRPRPMIAVLPFTNQSGTSDQDYFADGFTDELIAQLGALNPEALGVIARTTVSRYRDGRQSVDEIGRALDVEYVLEGSVRRIGDHVRITAQLIDVSNQTQLWAETYDHDVRDVLRTQRDVAMRVAGSLTMSVLRVAAVRPMPPTEAYDATLRGRALRQQATEASLALARQAFAQAIAIDPTYAPAHAGLADVFHVLGGPGWEFERPRDLLQQARASAERAIDLDARLPDGYAVRGMARMWLEGDIAGAEDDLRRAIALNGSYALAHQYLSTVLVVTGRGGEGVVEAQRAAELDPLSPASGTTVGYRFYYAGRFDDALREFDRALENAPGFASAWLGKAQTLRALGRTTESRAALASAEEHAGGRLYIRAYTAYALAADGDLAAGRAIQRELNGLAATRYISPFHFALVAAGLGDGAEVRRQIARLREDGSGWTVFVPIERELAPFQAAAAPGATPVPSRLRSAGLRGSP